MCIRDSCNRYQLNLNGIFFALQYIILINVYNVIACCVPETGITHLCSECRARLTDDEKSLLEHQVHEGLFSDNESQTDLLDLEDDQSGEDLSFELQSQISCDVSDVTTSTSCLYSGSEDELDEPMSPARRLRSQTNPASDEEKEQIFVEARIKIYKAAAEHRKNITGSKAQPAPSHGHRRLSDILKRKKTVSQ